MTEKINKMENMTSDTKHISGTESNTNYQNNNNK